MASLVILLFVLLISFNTAVIQSSTRPSAGTTLMKSMTYSKNTRVLSVKCLLVFTKPYLFFCWNHRSSNSFIVHTILESQAGNVVVHFDHVFLYTTRIAWPKNTQQFVIRYEEKPDENNTKAIKICLQNIWTQLHKFHDKAYLGQDPDYTNL